MSFQSILHPISYLLDHSYRNQTMVNSFLSQVFLQVHLAFLMNLGRVMLSITHYQTFLKPGKGVSYLRCQITFFKACTPTGSHFRVYIILKISFCDQLMCFSEFFLQIEGKNKTSGKFCFDSSRLDIFRLHNNVCVLLI